MKAFKSTDSYVYFRFSIFSGWVINTAVLGVKDKKLFIVKGKCHVIERETRLQLKCAVRFDQKAGEVTASYIQAACHANPDKPIVSLLKMLCYPVAYKDPNSNTPHSQDKEEFEAGLDRQVMNIAIIGDSSMPASHHEMTTIVVEGTKILEEKDISWCCSLLIGIIYALNLSYCKELKYTFEVFQKLFLELDALKTSAKVMNLKNSIF